MIVAHINVLDAILGNNYSKDNNDGDGEMKKKSLSGVENPQKIKRLAKEGNIDDTGASLEFLKKHPK